MDNNGNLFNQVVNDTWEPAKNQSVAGFVLGILSVVLTVFNFFLPELSLPGALILGIVGICLSATAKKRGNVSGICRAGLTLSIIGVVLNSVVLVGCVACLGCASCLACSGLAFI